MIVQTPVRPGETPQEWSARVLGKTTPLPPVVEEPRPLVAEIPKRKRTKTVVAQPRKTAKEFTPVAIKVTAQMDDETFRRVRAACCEFSPIDLDDHAARITLDALNAKAVRRAS